MASMARDCAGEYEPVLTPAEAAGRLCVDVHTLARWTRQGKVACVVLPSGHRRYRVSDVEALLQPYEPPQRPKKAPTTDPRPGLSRQGRVTPPGAHRETPAPGRGSIPAADARLAALPTPPGARPAQTVSQQRPSSAGLAAARAPGGLKPVSYGGRP